jgi:hypothetical protein
MADWKIDHGVPIPLLGKGRVGTHYDKARREFEPIYKQRALQGEFKKRGSKMKVVYEVQNKYRSIKKAETVYGWMRKWDVELKNPP